MGRNLSGNLGIFRLFCPKSRSYLLFRMGSIAGSISGVEKQLEEQTALHLEFEQRKVSECEKKEEGRSLCDSDVGNFKLAKKNVFNWRARGEEGESAKVN